MRKVLGSGVGDMQKYKILLLISLTVVVLDQITKALIAHYFYLHQSIEVISGFFNITYIRNPGAAFSLFSDSNEIFRAFFLIAISIVALIIVFLVYRSLKNNRLYRLALSLIAGGAVGNLIDRIRLKEVIDFLDIYIGRYHWPAFNVADSAITIGVFLAVLSLSKKEGV